MAISLLKHECKKLGIEKLESNKDGILISFHNNKFKHPEKLLQMIFASNNNIKLQASQKVLFVNKSQQEKIDSAFKVIRILSLIL